MCFSADILPWHFICTFRGTILNYAELFFVRRTIKAVRRTIPEFSPTFANFRDSSHAKKLHIRVRHTRISQKIRLDSEN
jgi:hypothetical protein